MDQKGRYLLRSADRIIAAKLDGCWTAALDLMFMNQLCEEFRKIQLRGTWGLFVDMRDWRMDDDIIKTMQQVKHDLDRRNQISECWLVANDQQGHFLLPFFDSLPFDLHRCYEQQQVFAWLDSQEFNTGNTSELIESTIG